MAYKILEIVGADNDSDRGKPRLTPGLTRVYLQSFRMNKIAAASVARITITELEKALDGKNVGMVIENKLLQACQGALDSETFALYALPKRKPKKETPEIFELLQPNTKPLSHRVASLAERMNDDRIKFVAIMIAELEKEENIAKELMKI